MTRPDYAYQSSQESILRPYYMRFLWNHILRVLPRSLSPNLMTLIATGCCALSFVLAATLRDHPVALVAAAVLILAYLTLDNLDGAQARRIGRSTRLGEFLDHWLDTLNNGFVVLGACFAAGLPPRLTLVVLSAASLAFYAVQWELRQTGVFRMGRLADVEGNTTVALLYLALAALGPDCFQARPIAGLPNLAVWLGCGVAGQAVWTGISALRRVPDRRASFVPITLAHAALLAWAAADARRSALPFLAIAYFLNPVFTSGPVLGRLLGLTTSRFDWSVVAVLVAGAGAAWAGSLPADASAPPLLVAAGLAALTLRYCLLAVSALRD